MVIGQTFRPGLMEIEILYDVKPIDGPFNIVGSAGWTSAALECKGFKQDEFCPHDLFPLTGNVTFDADDFMMNKDSPTWFDSWKIVTAHEMCHVFGIGTLWPPDSSPYPNYRARTNCTKDKYGEYRGDVFHNAPAAYVEIGGAPSSTAPPIEFMGSPGTVCVHWSEEFLDEELMTGFLENSPGTSAIVREKLSKLTLGALADLNYEVNDSNADPYMISNSRRTLAGTDRMSEQVYMDEVARMVREIQSRGVFKLLRDGKVLPEGLPKNGEYRGAASLFPDSDQ